MLEKAFKITNSTGLDAKMSSMIVTRSTKFISNITIQLDDLKINSPKLLKELLKKFDEKTDEKNYKKRKNFFDKLKDLF